MHGLPTEVTSRGVQTNTSPKYTFSTVVSSRGNPHLHKNPDRGRPTALAYAGPKKPPAAAPCWHVDSTAPNAAKNRADAVLILPPASEITAALCMRGINMQTTFMCWDCHQHTHNTCSKKGFGRARRLMRGRAGG